MPDRPDSLHTLGLEIESSLIRGAKVSLQKKIPIVEEIFESDVAEFENLHQHYKKDIEKSLIVTNLATSEVLIRSLEIKLKKEKDVDAVLTFQTEPLLPYPLENGVIDRIIIGPQAEGTLLTVIAARKDHVQQHLETWHSLHIEPEVTSCVPAALASFSKHFYPTDNPLIVLHLGRSSSTCILVDHNKLLAGLSCNNGIHKFMEADSEASQADYFTTDNKVLISVKETLRLDITRIIYSLSKQFKGKEIKEILITGEGSTWINLPQALLQGMNKVIVEPVSNLKYSTRALQEHAVPIGSALGALPQGGDLINFRQNEFEYPNPWKRYKNPLAIYLALCILLAGAVYFFGNAYVSQREDSLKKEYSGLLVTMHKPYNSFEAEYEKKFPPETPLDEGQTIPLIKMTQEDIANRIRFLENELQITPDSFPLLPYTPKVSDVLAWLSQHPAMVNPNQEQPIQIDNLTYTMVKRPEQTKKQEKYQVKVEFEFSSPTPKQAREFHDALIAPNDFVDPKGEVKWSSNRGKYRTSFYLKDRTVYPSST